MKEKILTRKIVRENGWDKLKTITADMLNGYTRIGYTAFQDCSSLESITLPDSITSIGGGAFYYCSNLTSIIIPNSVTSIGCYTFSGCSNLTSITIPNSVTSIGVETFSGCSNLTSITIPDSVAYIGEYAFIGCSRLTSINIPNSVTSIGGAAFRDCSDLTSITIPNSVTRTECKAFYNCGFKVKKRYDEQGRLIAYKGFDADMTCRNFQYEESKTYELKGRIELCKRGFHACINPMDCLNYYPGEIGKWVVFHEVYLEGVSDENCDDSKVVARKITIGREITLSEMADLASGRERI